MKHSELFCFLVKPMFDESAGFLVLPGTGSPKAFAPQQVHMPPATSIHLLCCTRHAGSAVQGAGRVRTSSVSPPCCVPEAALEKGRASVPESTTPPPPHPYPSIPLASYAARSLPTRILVFFPLIRTQNMSAIFIRHSPPLSRGSVYPYLLA